MLQWNTITRSAYVACALYEMLAVRGANFDTATGVCALDCK